MTRWIVEKLDKHQHDRAKFSCGVEVLDNYLKTRANKEQQNRLNVTYVAAGMSQQESLKPISGFYTLSNSAMKRECLPFTMQKNVPPTYDIPSIKLGRLAVDSKFQKQGIGKILLQNAFTRILEMSALTGIKCVEVVAKDKNAENFYKKFGFIPLEKSTMLVLPIETLVKASNDEINEN